MAVDPPAKTQEKPPVDPGCLPAWDTGDLPQPIPFGWKNLLALIGPGIVLVGGSLGTGEWVMGPQAAAKYMGALLWVVPLAILCQAFLNTEAMRYTLLTGEPVFAGFLRSKPGPRFWLIWYLCLDCLSWWPALAGLAAQIILFTLFGSARPDDPDHQTRVQLVNAGILLLCATLLCFGGKIYNTLEWILSGKVFIALGYTLFVALVFVPWSVWQNVLLGMFNPFITPVKDGVAIPVDWALIAALAGYAGVGGMGNTLSSNYVREKGWGMGAKVGAIPSAVGGHHITLSHLGTMCRPTPENQERFKRWWTHIKVDQYGIWVWGSIIGMLLPCLIGAAYLQGDYIQGKSQWEAAAVMASDLGKAHPAIGELLTKMTLLCGFIILFPGQLSSMDGIARRWCDALWCGSRRLRAMDTHSVKYVYYSFVGGYVLFGLMLVSLRISPPKMMQIAGNMANLAVLSSIIHTLYVNNRFLPREFRPSLLKQVALLAGALFYVAMFSLMTYQLVDKVMHGKL